MKKMVSLLLCFILLLSVCCFRTAAEGDILVYVDGQKVSFDVPPQMINNRTMVPMRAIFEAIGAEVTWDAETRTASSSMNGTVVSIQIGADALVKNGEKIPLDVPAQVIDSRTLVPARAIAESFDCRVLWNGDQRAVRIVTTHLDEEITPRDRQVYAMVGEHSFSYAYYDFMSKNGATDEEILKDMKETVALRELAKQYDCKLSVYDIDALDTQVAAIWNDSETGDFMRDAGLTVQVFRQAVQENRLWETIAYLSSMAYIEDTSALSGYVRERAIRVKHILVETQQEAQEILNQLKQGASFEELIKEKSLDGMDADTGYVFGRGDMVEPFEKAAYALNPGEISDVVESQYGFHVIKRYDIGELSGEQLCTAVSLSLVQAYCSARLYDELERIESALTVTFPEEV